MSVWVQVNDREPDGELTNPVPIPNRGQVFVYIVNSDVYQRYIDFGLDMVLLLS